MPPSDPDPDALSGWETGSPETVRLGAARYDEPIEIPGHAPPRRLIIGCGGLAVLLGTLGMCALLQPDRPALEPYEYRAPSRPTLERNDAERAAIGEISAALREEADALEAHFRAAEGTRAGLEVGGAACPYELPEPPRADPGETLGLATLQRGVNAPSFEPIIVDSQTTEIALPAVASLRRRARETEEDTTHTVAELRARAASSDSISVIYVRTRYDEPTAGSDGYSFEPGSTEGTAYLFDHAEGRYVCAAAVRATNSDSVQLYRPTTPGAFNRPGPRMELTMDLHNERNRAIARGMRAVIERAE